MNVWTAFFLVVSIVILAAPLLFAWDAADRLKRTVPASRTGGAAIEDDELDLDLASGRLTREDYEEMCGRKPEAGSVQDEAVGGDHENLAEG